MECPACRGKRVPCATCLGKRAIVGPCASPGEQARQDIGVRIVGTFEPLPPGPPVIELRVPHDAPARPTMDGVKRVAAEHPGDHVLRLLVPAREPPKGWRDGYPAHATLTLGEDWRYSGSAECIEALSEFGLAQVVDG